MRKKDIKWSNLKISSADISEVNNVLRKSDISGFSKVINKFEQEVKKETANKYAIACANGTVALYTAFLAIKILKKNKILKIAVPTWSYISPANAASYVGKLYLVDSDFNTFNINPKKIPKNIDIICAVDMAGIPSDYENIKKHKKIIVSDAAESLGCLYKKKKIGSNALITTTSFQVSKIITTGEGGMIFTDNKKIHDICRLIINQGYGSGGYEKHDHISKGMNFRITGMQAALGLSQMKRFKKLLKNRISLGKYYNKKLSKVVNIMNIGSKYDSSYYSYLIILKNKKLRDRLAKYLIKNGVETKLWKPIHLYKPYKEFDKKKFPIANKIYDTHLRLPINNQTSKRDIDYICKLIKIFFIKK